MTYVGDTCIMVSETMRDKKTFKRVFGQFYFRLKADDPFVIAAFIFETFWINQNFAIFIDCYNLFVFDYLLNLQKRLHDDSSKMVNIRFSYSIGFGISFIKKYIFVPNHVQVI